MSIIKIIIYIIYVLFWSNNRKTYKDEIVFRYYDIKVLTLSGCLYYSNLPVQSVIMSLLLFITVLWKYLSIQLFVSTLYLILTSMFMYEVLEHDHGRINEGKESLPDKYIKIYLATILHVMSIGGFGYHIVEYTESYTLILAISLTISSLVIALSAVVLDNFCGGMIEKKLLKYSGGMFAKKYIPLGEHILICMIIPLL
jgi:hypothetical protein